jgi:hypothetical protein
MATVEPDQPAFGAGICPLAGLPNVRATRLARRIENPAFVGVKSGFPAITKHSLTTTIDLKPNSGRTN